MKITIITENFLRIFLFCTAFVGISTFAIEFADPETVETPLKGKNLKLVKSISEETKVTPDDITRIAPKLSKQQRGRVFFLFSRLISTAHLRNDQSKKIDEYQQTRGKKIAEFAEKQPTYKDDERPTTRETRLLYRSINRLKRFIEDWRKNRVDTDNEIIGLINDLDTLFEEADYSKDYWRKLL